MYEGKYTVIGPPGTGKTTFLGRQVRKVLESDPWSGDDRDSPAIVVSLTRAAAHEVIRHDLPLPDTAISTLHSQGYRQQGSPDIVSATLVQEQWNQDSSQPWELSTHGFVNSTTDDLANSDDRQTHGDTIYAEYELARHGLKKTDGEIQAFGVRWAAWKKKHGVIDFTDMLEGASPTPPLNARYIIVDEAQDMSPLEVKVLTQWADGRVLFACGDPRQALYVWRGANPMWLVTNDESKKRILSKSWRLPRSIRTVSEAFVRRMGAWTQYNYAPRDEEGIVERCHASTINPLEVVQQATERVQSGRTAMIAATCGYMLHDIIATLRSNAVPFSNPWRLKQGRWNPLAVRKGTTMADRLVAIQASVQTGRLWSVDQVAKFAAPLEASGTIRHGQKTAIQLAATQQRHRAVTFEELATWFEPDRLDELWRLAIEKRNGADLAAWWLSRLLKSYTRQAEYAAKVYSRHGLDALTMPPKLFVGTVHSFKGAEADCVWLFPDLSPAACYGWDMRHGECYDAVVRTIYVGMTRAKHELHLCDGEAKSVDWQ